MYICLLESRFLSSFFLFLLFFSFFFKQDELSGNKNKNTRMLWTVKYYQLQGEAMQTADD